MSADDLSNEFPGEQGFEGEPLQETSSGGGCLRGCLIAAGILLLLLVVAGVVISFTWRSIASSIGRQAVTAVLEESGLDDAEKQEIREQMERIFAALESGELTSEQADRLFVELGASELSASIIAGAIERQYFDASGLSDAEKEAGRMAIHRCVRGVLDDKLSQEDLDAVLANIATRQEDGSWELKDTVTDEELREFLRQATEKADAAGIPAEVEPVDPSDEIRRIIDAVLGPTTGAPAMPTESESGAPAAPDAEPASAAGEPGAS